jgi:hypothetical protein
LNPGLTRENLSSDRFIAERNNEKPEDHHRYQACKI